MHLKNKIRFNVSTLKEVKIKVKSAHDIGDPTLVAKRVVEEEEKIGDENADSGQIDYDLIKSKLKKAQVEDENKPAKRAEPVDEKKLKT